MARDLDGTDDWLDFGSDASIDDLASRSFAFWFVRDFQNNGHALFMKSNDGQWALIAQNDANSNRLRYRQGYSILQGTWITTTSITAGRVTHVAVVHDPSSGANNPSIYVDGVLETLSSDTDGIGTQSSDAAETLFLGVNGAGNQDFDGRMGWLIFADALWTAAQVNRARWWGRVGGAVAVLHPLMTDKLANEGTATANATPTGTTVASLAVPVVRPGSAMMGLGVGW